MSQAQENSVESSMPSELVVDICALANPKRAKAERIFIKCAKQSRKVKK